MTNLNNARESGRAFCAWLLSLGMSLTAVNASAVVLFEQSPLDGGNAYFSNIGAGVQNADSFSFGGAVTVENFTWWGSYGVDNGDDFVVRIFGDAGAAPGSLMTEYTSQTIVKNATLLTDNGGAAVWEFSWDVSPTSFGGGTYYLSVMNESSEWFWLTSSDFDDNFYRAADGDVWTADASGNLSMQINGTRVQIPEPDSIALVMLAGGLLLMSRRLGNRRRA